ncbi:MAG: uridine-cytidine kinase [Cytophagales bacterium]|nr:uridine-cytidine kinase [Bernardetiaceae bacterium]MDW8209527.1 uridine-cytidine kinase [Cytophagales bacterium]
MTQPFLIGVSGGSGAGKTYFLNKLMYALGEESICLISQDHYYRDKEQQPTDENGVKNFDTPESIDSQQLLHDLKQLYSGSEVRRKEYTFNNPAITPRTLIFRPRPVIILEGLFVFYYPEIAQLIDLKIFIEAKDHIKIKRRILRDNLERGCDINDVLYRYEHHVMPAYEKYISPLKNQVDIIIPNNQNPDKALEVIVGFLRYKLS